MTRNMKKCTEKQFKNSWSIFFSEVHYLSFTGWTSESVENLCACSWMQVFQPWHSMKCYHSSFTCQTRAKLSLPSINLCKTVFLTNNSYADWDGWMIQLLKWSFITQMTIILFFESNICSLPIAYLCSWSVKVWYLLLPGLNFLPS